MRSLSAMQAMLLSARCLVSYSPFAPAVISSWPVELQNTQIQPLSRSFKQPPCPSVPPAAWSSNSRGFFSSIGQPESKAYKERRLIGYSPEQLYEVVSGVQHYKQFVPWCVGSTVLTQRQDGRYLEAELQIGFQMISERYTSRVTLQPPHKVSSTVADSALFHHLESTWQMTPGPSPNSTWLSFSVDFAFLNPLYANVAQLFFAEVVTRMMGAFEGRCKELYGQPSFAAPGRGQPQHVRHMPPGQQRLAVQQQQQRVQHSPPQQLAVAAAGTQTGSIESAKTDMGGHGKRQFHAAVGTQQHGSLFTK